MVYFKFKKFTMGVLFIFPKANQQAVPLIATHIKDKALIMIKMN